MLACVRICVCSLFCLSLLCVFWIIVTDGKLQDWTGSFMCSSAHGWNPVSLFWLTLFVLKVAKYLTPIPNHYYEPVEHVWKVAGWSPRPCLLVCYCAYSLQVNKVNMHRVCKYSKIRWDKSMMYEKGFKHLVINKICPGWCAFTPGIKICPYIYLKEQFCLDLSVLLLNIDIF